jgi:hypothetical protein
VVRSVGRQQFLCPLQNLFCVVCPVQIRCKVYVFGGFGVRVACAHCSRYGFSIVAVSSVRSSLRHRVFGRLLFFLYLEEGLGFTVV